MKSGKKCRGLEYRGDYAIGMMGKRIVKVQRRRKVVKGWMDRIGMVCEEREGNCDMVGGCSMKI